MPHVQAKRRLVKSPPELWTELSDAAALERHLGEFGEIRITRLEPERKVAWEGERASGLVELDSAGWGTQVTFTVEVPEPEAAEPALEPEPELELEPEAHEPEAHEPEVEPAEPEPEPEPEPEALEPHAAEAKAGPVEPEPGPEPEAEPPARPGFWTRLFGARWKELTQPPPGPQSPAAEPAHVEAEPELGGEPDPGKSDPVPELAKKGPVPAKTGPVPELVAEPQPEPAADAGADRTQAVLEAVLDSLGSAHHRPFSRA